MTFHPNSQFMPTHFLMGDENTIGELADAFGKKLKFTVLQPVDTFLKGTAMLGFRGNFTVNFEIPDYWGIGKSVSRGFGTVKKVESQANSQGKRWKREDLYRV